MLILVRLHVHSLSGSACNDTHYFKQISALEHYRRLRGKPERCEEPCLNGATPVFSLARFGGDIFGGLVMAPLAYSLFRAIDRIMPSVARS